MADVRCPREGCEGTIETDDYMDSEGDTGVVNGTRDFLSVNPVTDRCTEGCMVSNYTEAEWSDLCERAEDAYYRSIVDAELNSLLHAHGLI